MSLIAILHALWRIAGTERCMTEFGLSMRTEGMWLMVND